MLATKIGQLLGASVIDTLTLARLAQGLASIIVGYFALRLAYFGRLTLFVILCLPMTLSLAGSVSQDGVMISSVALAFALITRPGSRPIWSGVTVAVLLGAAAAARTPYLPLLVMCTLPTFTRHSGPDDYVEAAGWLILALCVALVWIGVGLVPTITPLPMEGVLPDEQVKFLLSHPTAIFMIASETMKPMRGVMHAASLAS